MVNKKIRCERVYVTSNLECYFTVGYSGRVYGINTRWKGLKASKVGSIDIVIPRQGLYRVVNNR